MLERREPLLTARQAQIARLAVRYPNAVIAERLSISVRTVESHLHTVYYTLGDFLRSIPIAVSMMAKLLRIRNTAVSVKLEMDQACEIPG